MENEGSESDGQKHLRMIHYYYINYKQFVNVVKYRLDHMRRKLEMEEKKVKDGGVYMARDVVSPCMYTLYEILQV